MKLIVGLGNIGVKYELSRHNAGFMCLSQWSEKHKVGFKHDVLFNYARYKNACLIKPNTYMNRSGLALAEALKKWQADEVLVLHDDIELPLAKLRLRQAGGDGGHNGVKSLLEVMPEENLKRIRIGIGMNEGDPRDFVLDVFSEEELLQLQPALDKAIELIDTYIKSDFNAVLDKYSIWSQSCSGEKEPGNKSPKEKEYDQGL
jgi:peptidyl-tRNA hydrolase, PTH1 family